MKKLICIFALLYFVANTLAWSNEIKGFAMITGKVDYDLKYKEINLQKVVEGKLKTVSMTTLDENGEFGFILPVDEAGFYHISITNNSNLLRFYLENGLELDLTIEEEGYELAGEHLGHNELVSEWNKTVSEMLEINDRKNILAGYKEFFPLLENEVIPKAEEMKEKINTGDENFDKLMKLSVQTDLEEQAFAFSSVPRTYHPKREDYPDFYYTWEEDVKFTDPDILKLWNGQSYMTSYSLVYDFVLKPNEERPKDLNNLTRLISRIEDPTLKDVYLRNYFSRTRFQGGQYQKAMAVARPYMTSEESQKLIVELEKDLFTEVGQPGFKFEYEDINGELVSFDSFKGKIVYLDIWATWCGPCIKQIPYLKELEQELHGEDIVFLSISIDAEKDKDKWKNFVAEKDLKGVQLMVDNDWESGLVKNYEIKGIPRFMIFDKEGNIVTTDAVRPSSPDLKGQLLELLNP
ncbi:TlpA disulfide reductase family protein [Algoriphagus halophytocola]|uniref:AhpC/TSA family protein n=1 Tax=Algoriphagus halophytocola TaxID=2991499 RepID=A0ABY6MES7_9BACT|nr:TlpA disulfide reductase family protein [Algoriphagus sp. TR-M5]UZD21136.1 AhpC/TSA family protein [Algoriphagus sp. TR-M5]